jgi:hypothetical protein
MRPAILILTSLVALFAVTACATTQKAPAGSGRQHDHTAASFAARR